MRTSESHVFEHITDLLRRVGSIFLPTPPLHCYFSLKDLKEKVLRLDFFLKSENSFNVGPNLAGTQPDKNPIDYTLI